MAKFEDDELDDVKPKKATKVAVEEEEEEAPKPKAKAVVDDDDDEKPKGKKGAGDDEEVEDLDADWGDEKLMQRSDGLEKLTPEKGKVVRFAILPFVKPKKAMVHYIEKKGKYRCHSTDEHQAICCKKLGDSDLRVVALVVHYTNANSKDGKMEKGAPIEYEIKFGYFSRTNYRAISKLPEEDQSVLDIDIVMSHRDNGIGYEFNKIASKARWKVNPELAKEIEEACQKFLDGKKLVGKLGKKVTLIEMKATLASLTAGDAEEADLSGVDDL